MHSVHGSVPSSGWQHLSQSELCSVPCAGSSQCGACAHCGAFMQCMMPVLVDLSGAVRQHDFVGGPCSSLMHPRSRPAHKSAVLRKSVAAHENADCSSACHHLTTNRQRHMPRRRLLRPCRGGPHPVPLAGWHVACCAHCAPRCPLRRSHRCCWSCCCAPGEVKPFCACTLSLVIAGARCTPGSPEGEGNPTCPCRQWWGEGQVWVLPAPHCPERRQRRSCCCCCWRRAS